MNQAELQKKLDGLLENAKFTDKVAMCGNVEEIASLLAANGVEISAEDLKQALATTSGEDGDELSNCELTGVSGGGVGGLALRTAIIVTSKLKLLIPTPILPIKRLM